MELYRGLQSVVESAMGSMPIVVVEGPRAAGKTTLTRAVAHGNNVFDLSAADVYAQAAASPRAWVESLPVGSVIDEAQRINNLSLEVKRQADGRPGVKGQYLLTGSVRLNRDELGGSDPLVGRVRRCTLLPFAQCELADGPKDVLAALFDGDPGDWVAPPAPQQELFALMIRGGFPLVQPLNGRDDRRNALADYVRDLFASSVVQTRRDVSAITSLFRWLSASSGQLQNISGFGQANGLAKETVAAYLAELERVFLIRTVPSWHHDPGKRETTSARLFVVDPSFSADAHDLARHHGAALQTHGRIFETFALTEIERLASWSSVRTRTYHWRIDEKREVDAVLEDESTGRLIVIEVKAARESSAGFFQGINAFRARYPKQFHRGIVLHCGDHPLRHADDMWSLPFSALWTLGERVGSADSGSLVARRLRIAERVIENRRSLKPSSPNAIIAFRSRVADAFFGTMHPDLVLVVDRLERLGFSATYANEGNPEFPDTLETPSLWHETWTLADSFGRATLKIATVAELQATGETTWTLVAGIPGGREVFRRAVQFTMANDSASERDLRVALQNLIAGFIDDLPDLIDRLEGRDDSGEALRRRTSSLGQKAADGKDE